MIEQDENDVSEGIESFNEKEQVFCRTMTELAKKITMKYSGKRAVTALLLLAGKVMDSKKSDPDLCTGRVYFFCMSWLAGAVSSADSGRIGMLHCGIAFLAGAAIVKLVVQ
jgi:hypothetical protein